MMRLLAIGLLVILGANLGQAADKKVLRAGAYAMDVTPEKYPISVNGNFTDKQATSAHDRLHARCLVLDDGTTKLAIVVIDSCMLPRELVDAAKAQASKRTGIPTSHMLISATHTHTAPTSAPVFQSDPNPEYPPYLIAKIAAGIAKAAERLAPAEVGAAAVAEPSQLFNRRWRMKPGTINSDPFGGTTDIVRMNPGYQNPGLLEQAGTVDPDVSILAARTPEGKPIALLGNYSLHYVGDFPALSADYFGVFAERIGPMLGATEETGFVGILSNGTSGDVNNIDFANPPVKTSPGEKCRTVGEVVAKAAKKGYDKASFKRELTLAAAEQEIELGVRKPTPADLERAQGVLKKANKPVLQTAEEVYARETVLMAKYPDTVKMKLQVLRIGDLAITAIPCEVFTEIGLTIKKMSPFPRTFTIELANGYNGYLPTPAQHKLGGYETWRARSSYLEVNASDKIIATLDQLLKQVRSGS